MRDTALSVTASPLARFVVVGAGLFLFDSALFFTAVWGFGVGAVAAQAFARIVASVAGFLWHRGFTFRHEERAYRDGATTQGAGFFGLTGFNIALSPALMWAALAVLPVPLVLTKVLVEGLLAVETYVVLKLVFRHGEEVKRE